jgi:hypothetical protein
MSEPITFLNMHVFAAYNLEQTLIARQTYQITDDMLILESLIIFAKNLETADFMLYLTGLHPECEIIFYLHLPEAKDYRPLIRAVTRDHKSFPYYFNN